MDDIVVHPGLSQVERVVDTFVAPSKTFTDILRSTSWWLPFVLLVLVGFFFNVAVDKKVGFDQVSQQQMSKNKMQSDRIDAMPPDQKAAVMRMAVKQTKIFSYGSAVIILLFALIASLLWWVTINFAFGASTKFSQIFAVWMYASLPKVILYAVCAGLLFAGVGLDSFDIQNPLGTNPAYYMTDAGAGLKVALSFFDVFGLWSLALGILGVKTVSGKSTMAASISVGAWWLLGMAILAGLAAAFS